MYPLAQSRGNIDRHALTPMRRGSVAVWMALSLVPTLTLIALGLDESQGTIAKIQLQRIADIASMAGGLRGANTATGVPSLCSSAQYAKSCAETNAAADTAEVNGVAGTKTRVWSDTTLTLTDNMITAKIVPGVDKASDVAVQVTVSRSLPSIFAYPVDGGATYTVSATAISEVVAGTTTTGPQPCFGSLSGNFTSTSANTQLHSACSIRSNAAVILPSSGNTTSAGIYAATTITGDTQNNTTYPNYGQIPDPYANNTAVASAFSDLTTQTTRTFTGGGNGATISPGTYSSINITGMNGTTMSPGLYVVTGNFSVTGANANVTGTGVTIVVGGAVNISGTGGSNFNVSAPGTSPTNGAISGVLIADSGTSGGTIGSSNAAAISGVVYFPNSGFTINGTTNGGSCLEVLAASININANTVSVSGDNCSSSLGATAFGSVATSTATLVE
jgi:hypothetical protein